MASSRMRDCVRAMARKYYAAFETPFRHSGCIRCLVLKVRVVRVLPQVEHY